MTLRAATAGLLVRVALWFWLIGSGVAAAGDDRDGGRDPQEWLERMTVAMSQMTYQGTFVYLQGDEVVTMRITHVADESGVRERLVALSGAPREVLRDASGVRWVLGDGHAVLQDQAFSRSFFPLLPLDRQGQTKRSYALKLGGTGRIAGQSARRLEVIPRDEYRYGYTLWLEQHSALLLKWQLLDSKGGTLAKLMFTDIRMGSEVDPGELNSSSPLQEFRTVESRLPAGPGYVQEAPRWQPSSLPPGFELTDHRFFAAPDAAATGGGMYEHLVYSDGLAAVSVYVESGADRQAEGVGVNRLGTTHTFSRVANGALITVVGDVPAATVRLIGDAVAPVER
jgi:sigma-E factor negative regulatory protein RseB